MVKDNAERDLWFLILGRALGDSDFLDLVVESFNAYPSSDYQINQLFTAMVKKDGRIGRKWLVDNYVGQNLFAFDKTVRDRVNDSKLIDEAFLQLKTRVAKRQAGVALSMGAAHVCGDTDRAADILRKWSIPAMSQELARRFLQNLRTPDSLLGPYHLG